MKKIATFSIVARDPKTGELGIAVQSKFLAVGSAVPWAKAGVGAIATQALANLSFGEIGLNKLSEGWSVQEVHDFLIANDPEIEHRQFGIVDAQGNAISFTGKQCFDHASHHAEDNLAVQGNILVSRATIDALVDGFKSAEGTLARRLLIALDKGQNAGGDKRGRQSAAILVVKEKGSYGGYNDRYIDLRVDDDPEPIHRLSHLLDLFEMTFGQTKEEDKVTLDEALVRRMQTQLQKLGFYTGAIDGTYDPLTRNAYEAWAGFENYEERMHPDDIVDQKVIAVLFSK